MEAYPAEYVQHNLPLVLLSGLGQREEDQPPKSKRQESGARIATESPECVSPRAKQLLEEFVALDGSRSAWNSTALPAPPANIRWRVKTIGRSYTLPARKAAPNAQTAGVEGSVAPRSTELHSTLSPLSPGSPVFPDGLFTPAWFHKHQDLVPALFLSFFDLDSEDASQDEQLKADINSTRTALTRSGYKSRFAVVLLSEKSILQAPELEDRMASIRRATGLQVFFMPPMSSQAEISTFVRGTMVTLQPSCMEYYRELTKHARRKKTKGGPPPQSSQAQGGAVPSASAWNVRYELKQGVFDEFTQSMAAAEGHYSAVIEELFSSEGGVFETTASWSPRWDEARLLCDALALRVVRCQLWAGQTTGAVQSWVNYKLRMKDLVDRRGKGSLTYSWSAWEGRWAEVMAQVVEMANVPSLRSGRDVGEESVVQIYAAPDKILAPSDRLPPFNFLHHSGYWLRLLTSSIRTRWERALAIPEEDRVPPGQSPASKVANRFVTYDTYLVPEPHMERPLTGEGGYDHAANLGTATIRAVEAFEARRQMRMSEQLRFALAEDLARVGQYADATQLLVQLWDTSTWREDEWLFPFSKLLHLLYDCVNREKLEKHATLIPALTWELLALHNNTDLVTESYDLTNCLDNWGVQDPIVVDLKDRQRLCPVAASFAFEDIQSHVGELLRCQLTLACKTSASTPLQISRVELKIGTARGVIIRHEASSDVQDASTVLLNVPKLHESTDGTLEGSADLALHPAQRKIYDISFTLREAQIFRVRELVVVVETERFALSHSLEDDSIRIASQWHILKDGQANSVLVPHMDTKSVNVLPKPPNMQVLLHGMRKQYYTDEQIRLPVELVNDEAETVSGTIESILVALNGEVIGASWSSDEHGSPLRKISDLISSKSDQIDLLIDAPSEATTCTITLELQYTLQSDPSTYLSKTLSMEVEFIHPFEAMFNFAPRLHRQPWPSYFSSTTLGTASSPDGIPQLWSLGTQINSLIDYPLTIISLELKVHEVQGDSLCTLTSPVISTSQSLPPQSRLSPQSFTLTTQKHSLDDRRATGLDLSLIVTWSHPDNPSPSTTIVAVPRLNIPTSEPRVLCDVAAYDSATSTVTVQYHLENPSTHFLTFALTMEANEDFACSGPKYRTLSLAPLSRHVVEFRLVMHRDVDGDEGKGGLWIKPVLQVVDSYYQKNLRINPGGSRVRLDGKREVEVWVGEEDPQ